MGYKAYATTDEIGHQLFSGLSIGCGLKTNKETLAEKAKPPVLPSNMSRIREASFFFDESRLEGDKRLAKYNFLASVALRKERELGRVSVGSAKRGKHGNQQAMLYLLTDRFLYAAPLEGGTYECWEI